MEDESGPDGDEDLQMGENGAQLLQDIDDLHPDINNPVISTQTGPGDPSRDDTLPNPNKINFTDKNLTMKK